MDMYSVAEAAALLGVSQRTVRHRLRTGVMQGERAGRWTWLVSYEEVEKWREQGKLKPGRKPSESTTESA
jgi:excisionase family DNA binding protein